MFKKIIGGFLLTTCLTPSPELGNLNSIKDIYLEANKPVNYELSNEIHEKLASIERIEVEKQKQYISFQLTHYTDDDAENIPGQPSTTCTGKKLVDGMVASNHYPLGTKIQLEDGRIVTVSDKGGSDFDMTHRLDVFVERLPGESDDAYKKRALDLGIIYMKGYIIEED